MAKAIFTRCCDCRHPRFCAQYRGQAAYRCFAKADEKEGVPCIARNHGECLHYEPKGEAA
jgi:hypothetical protein